MKTKFSFYLIVAVGVIISASILFLLYEFIFAPYFEVLHPSGLIGVKERNLLVTATLLMLIVVVPVLFLTFFIAWKYNEHHSNTKYTPDLRESVVAEFIWWGVPCLIIIALSIITWKKTHELDPFKPIVQSGTEPLTVQVVALQWKWLFIYPEQHIASLNYLQIPEKTPINFEITADAPMNSFWIPALGGQIFAMPGMKSKLHLIADEQGEFRGVSANISGVGFAGMKFMTKASSKAEFDTWVSETSSTPHLLGFEEYKVIAKPSENEPKKLYLLKDADLFDRIVMKYMMP